MIIHEVTSPPPTPPDDQPVRGTLSVMWSLLWRAVVLMPVVTALLWLSLWSLIGALLLPFAAFIYWFSGDSAKAGWLLLAWPVACALCYVLRRFIGVPVWLKPLKPFGKSPHVNNIAVGTILIGSLAATFAAEPATLSDADLLKTTQNRAIVLSKATPKPVLVKSWIAMLCNPPMKSIVEMEKNNPHTDRKVLVYTSPTNLDAIKRRQPGKAPMLPGSLVVKEKMKADDSTAELFGGMLKREKGYNPDCGDWEFFVISADGQTLQQRGKLTSCMECHRRYTTTDHIGGHYPAE